MTYRSTKARLSVAFALVAIGTVPAFAADGQLSGGILDIIEKGGPTMVAILLGSIIGLALAFERIIALRRSVLVPKELIGRVREEVQKGDVASLAQTLSNSKSALARILSSGLKRIEHGPQEMERAMETVGAHEINRLKRPVRPIALLASVEPLLGLLGTVFGMIQTFNTLHTTSAADRVTKLAPGIGTALYTTAAGLCIAIPFVLVYHWLIGKVNSAAEEWSNVGTDLVLGLTAKPDARIVRADTSRTPIELDTKSGRTKADGASMVEGMATS